MKNTNILLTIVLTSSLLTNIVLGVVAYKVIQMKTMIEVPLNTLNKVTKELSNDVKDFTIDEVKKSYEDGYIGEKTEELKSETDTISDMVVKGVKDYFKKD